MSETKIAKRVDDLLSRVRIPKDAARVLAALRPRGRVAIVSAILEKRPQRWTAKTEPRVHRRSWSGLPPALKDRPERYTVTIDGKHYSPVVLNKLADLGFVQPIRRGWHVRVRFRLVCTPERLHRILENILTAPTPARLEQAFQVGVRLFRVSSDAPTSAAVQEAMRDRGRQLCALRPLGRLVPRFDQRRRRLTIGRSSYHVAKGYNGAGVRYVWAWAKDWAQLAWKRRGVPSDVGDRVWEWWTDYPHRALRVLERVKLQKSTRNKERA